MTYKTDAAVQTQLDSDRFGRGVRIVRTVRISSGVDSRYVVPVVTYAGHAMWINTVASATASAQAAAILSALSAAIAQPGV